MHIWSLTLLPLQNFLNPRAKKNFNSHYAKIEILESHYLDEKTFKDCNFVQDFTEAGLKNLDFKVPQ